MAFAIQEGALGGMIARLLAELRLRLNSEMTLRGTNHLAIIRAQARADQAEVRLKEALNVLPEGIVFLDAEGRYVMWNDAYAAIYERSADLFREGVRLADTLRVGVERGDYPEAVGREEAWLAERLALLDNPGVRHEQRLANGRWILIEERKTSDGGTIGIRIDISELKAQAAALEQALEEARAASRAKGEFLANMSHEIRTPLNGVIGLADVLARTELDANQREVLRTLSASAADLNALLGDLLDFSKADAGKLQLAHEPFDLALVIADCARLYGPQAQAKGVELTVAIDEAARGVVFGDPVRVRQLLNNLVSNAVKFTEEGQVSLALNRDAAGAFVVTVRDTGIGFDQEQADRLFDRFEQADGAMSRKFGGTGLGLAICRQLTELMGGAIAAQGRRGEGAVFSVVLPLRPLEEAQTATDEVGQDCPPLHVLLVDDNPTNRKVVELMLSQVGAEITACENGQEAVDAYRSGCFDLVLMDLQMPVMDGFTATRTIREMERTVGRGRTPLVVLSANCSAEDRRASGEAGADAHIGKPIRAENLFSTIGDVLDAGEAAAHAA